MTRAFAVGLMALVAAAGSQAALAEDVLAVERDPHIRELEAHYLNGAGFNATRAAQLAGYKATSKHSFEAIGSENLAELAQRTGLSREELVQRLAKVIPEAVDTLTPDGQIGVEVFGPR